MTDTFNRPSKPTGPIATRHVYDRMKSLQVGEAFTVEWKEWRAATPPTITIGRSPRHRDHFKVEELVGGKGWRISRVK